MKDLLDPENKVRYYVILIAGVVLIKLGVDGLLLALFCCIYLLAGLIVRWYYKNKIINTSLISFVSWISLISWVVPILGVLTSSFAHSFYIQEKPESKKKYRNFAIVGGLLSVVNAVIPAILRKYGIE